MIRKNNIKRLLATVCLAASFGQPALAVEIGGVKMDDTTVVANKELKLNGAGLRVKMVFKVYALGLYLPEKKTTVADILASQGPRRVSIVMLREISSEDFSQAFMSGLNANADSAEKTKILNPSRQFNDMFTRIPGLKKGDVLTVDWTPGIGTQCQLNGKKIGETVPDLTFYNAILKIWIGDKPADSSLKPKLLGEVG